MNQYFRATPCAARCLPALRKFLESVCITTELRAAEVATLEQSQVDPGRQVRCAADYLRPSDARVGSLTTE